MAGLQARLDDFKKLFESGAPPYNAPHEAVETMHRATAELKGSGIEALALKAGDRAPVSPYSIKTTCRYPPLIFSKMDLWWSAF